MSAFLGKTMRKRTYPLKKRSRKPAKRPTSRWGTVGMYNKKPELKRMDTGLSNTQISTTPLIIALNLMHQGTDDNNRIGKEVSLHSLKFNGGIVLSAVRDNTFDHLRYMLIYDRQPNGLLPTIGDILKTIDLNGATSTDVFSHKNEDNRDRFLFLRDQRIGIPDDSQGALHPGVSCLASPFPGTINDYIPLKGLTTKYLSDSGTIASISTGALYFVMLGFLPASVANWTMNHVFRVTYSDV